MKISRYRKPMAFVRVEAVGMVALGANGEYRAMEVKLLEQGVYSSDRLGSVRHATRPGQLITADEYQRLLDDKNLDVQRVEDVAERFQELGFKENSPKGFRRKSKPSGPVFTVSLDMAEQLLAHIDGPSTSGASDLADLLS